MNNKKSTSLRIATWNIDRPKQNGLKKNPLIVEKLREIDADIWVLTETNASIVPEPKKPDPFWGYVGVASRPECPKKPGENKTTIWSRLGIIRTIETFDPDTAVCAEIMTPLGLMLVYGTIITYWGDTDKEFPEIWKKHQDEIKNHAKNWTEIRNAFPNHILCVAGDFNQNRDNSDWLKPYAMNKESVDQLSGHLKTNSLVCVTGHNIRENSEHNIPKEEIPRANIDHICLSERAANNVVTEYWYDKALSSHNGVCVNIQSPQS